MKIGYDTQTTQGEKTGLGYYTGELVKNVQQQFSQHEYLLINGAKNEYSSMERFFYDQLHVWKQIKDQKLDIFHKTAFSPSVMYSGKVVVTVPDLIGMLFPENFGALSRLYWSKWLPYAIKKSDYIITISEATKSDVIKLLNFPEEKIKTIYIAGNEHFQIIKNTKKLLEVKVKYNLPEKYLLFVGTNEPRKNLPRLVVSFSKIKNEFPELKLVIVGKKGWEKDSLQQKVEDLGLIREIIFPGYIDDKDLPNVYNLAEMLVFPSLYEGFGLPALEALSCGLPVVCSNNSSLPEVVGEAGILVDPRDSTDIANKIADVLNYSSDVRLKVIEIGLKQAKKFSWEKCAQETFEVYEKVMRY